MKEINYYGRHEWHTEEGEGALSAPVQGGPVWFLTQPVHRNFWAGSAEFRTGF